MRPHATIAVLLLFLVDCAPGRPPTLAGPQPFVGVQLSHGNGRGLWLGDWVLTANHVYLIAERLDPRSITLELEDGATLHTVPHPPQPRLVAGVPIEITDALHGRDDALDPINPLTRSGRMKPPAWREDWALLRVTRAAPASRTTVLLGDGSYTEGETLYIVGPIDPTAASPIETITVRPLRIDWRTEDGKTRPVPSRIITGSLDRERDLSGWSGSFVGRYHHGSDEWEYLGTLVGVGDRENEAPPAAIIIRPPTEVLARLFTPAHPGTPTPAGP